MKAKHDMHEFKLYHFICLISCSKERYGTHKHTYNYNKRTHHQHKSPQESQWCLQNPGLPFPQIAEIQVKYTIGASPSRVQPWKWVREDII